MGGRLSCAAAVVQAPNADGLKVTTCSCVCRGNAYSSHLWMHMLGTSHACMHARTNMALPATRCARMCHLLRAAGADVLFEDPGRRSTSVGVTVSPVRVASIEQFGDLEAVGQRLLDAERKKVGGVPRRITPAQQWLFMPIDVVHSRGRT